jgi:hypothetical protein
MANEGDLTELYHKKSIVCIEMLCNKYRLKYCDIEVLMLLKMVSNHNVHVVHVNY